MTTADLTEINPMHDALNAVIEVLKPLNVDQRRSVLQSAAHLFGSADVLSTAEQTVTTPGSQSNLPELERFVFEKKTSNDAIAVTVLAYYLAVYRKQETFKTADLDALNKQAGTGQVFGNISKTVNNATQRNRLLAMAGDGFKKITPLGRLVVEALPDEEKVQAILEEHKPRIKRKRRKEIER
jgi:hypothetical protein